MRNWSTRAAHRQVRARGLEVCKAALSCPGRRSCGNLRTQDLTGRAVTAPAAALPQAVLVQSSG
jgi:hypothetical protein